jgi:hypothetical protein
MPSRASDVMLGANQLSITPPCSDSRHFETPATGRALWHSPQWARPLTRYAPRLACADSAGSGLNATGLKNSSRQASSDSRTLYGNESWFGGRAWFTAGWVASQARIAITSSRVTEAYQGKGITG